MPVASAIGTPERVAKHRGGAATSGLAQLSLIEHALCPLDTKVSLQDGFRHNTGFYYGPSGRRRFANVTLTAGRGLSPGDEFFLWGLLALTLAERDGGIDLWATPHYCLRRLGCLGDGTKKGGGNYESFRQAIGRLAAVTYTSDAFFDPVRSEHRQVAFGFLSYSLPLDPASSRAWRIVWDPLFLEFCRATGGGRLFFDLDLYRDLDFASRRMFLMVHKLFGGSRHRVSPTTDARHFAVNVVGFAGHLPAKILNQKLVRVLQRMIDIGALQLPHGRSHVRDLFTKKAKGCYAVSLVPGKYFTTPAMPLHSRKPVPAESPLYDPLRAIGFQDAEIARILRSFPHAKVQVWSDVTLRAMEGARGFPGFKKDPKAYLLYHLKQARDNKLTPPDWWHAARREEERRQSEFSRRSSKPLGDDEAAAYWQAREAAMGEFIRDHQQDFDRLLQMFAAAHGRSMSQEDAHYAARQDARKHIEAKFHFPDEKQWAAEHSAAPCASDDKP